MTKRNRVDHTTYVIMYRVPMCECVHESCSLDRKGLLFHRLDVLSLIQGGLHL